MPQARFRLQLSNEQYLAYYSGHARNISVISEEGRRIEFPAEKLRPYITHTGVQGVFVLEYTEQGRFRSLQQLPPADSE